MSYLKYNSLVNSFFSHSFTDRRGSKMRTLLLLGLVAFFGLSQADSTVNVTSILNTMLEGYDKRVRPNYGGAAIDVGITMYFIQIYDISTKEGSIKADFYFRQMWTDPRLAFDAPINYITLGSESAKSIWEPDTFFPEGHAKFSHDGNMFLRINRDGSILKSVRVFAKSRINMDLTYFPQDKQIFSLSFESYGYTAKEILYKWGRGMDSVGMSKENSGGPDISVDASRTSSQLISLSSGNYSRLSVDVLVHRNHGYYCRHFYLPAIIAFLFAWASFWFHPSQPVVRILLILSSILMGNYLLAQSVEYIPQVHETTMLEKYIVFGLIMSALAVAECALVVFLERRARQSNVFKTDLETNLLDGDNKKPPKNQEADVDESKQKTDSYIIRSTKYIMTIHQHRRSHMKVDIFFRSLFPIIYIIYNIWYWMAFP